MICIQKDISGGTVRSGEETHPTKQGTTKKARIPDRICARSGSSSHPPNRQIVPGFFIFCWFFLPKRFFRDFQWFFYGFRDESLTSWPELIVVIHGDSESTYLLVPIPWIYLHHRLDRWGRHNWTSRTRWWTRLRSGSLVRVVISSTKVHVFVLRVMYRKPQGLCCRYSLVPDPQISWNCEVSTVPALVG
jgi:hypothetical protein